MTSKIFSQQRTIHTVNAHGLPGAHHRGFSLIELMMAIVLIAVGIGLAIPSFQGATDKRLLTSGAEQLSAFIKFTRGESIKRNQVVTISYSRTANDNWCIGAVLASTACDCTQTSADELNYCAIDSVWTVLDNTQVGNTSLMSAMSGNGEYAFEPTRGRLVEVDNLFKNASFLFELQSNDADYMLDLTVTSTGFINLCSKDEDHKVRGYKVCPAKA